MTSAPRRVQGWFVAAPAAPPSSPLTLVPAPPPVAIAAPDPAPAGGDGPSPARRSICVLGADGAALTFGDGLAQRLAHAAGAGSVVLLHWGPGTPGSVDRGRRRPRSGAQRLAARLVADGQVAVAHGRVARVALPDAAPRASEMLLRAAALPGVTSVAVLGGPYDEAFDAVLAAQDRILVVVRAAAPAALGVLATAAVAARAPAATVQLVPLPARLAGAVRRAAVGRAVAEIGR